MKKRMRKPLALLLALVMVLSFAPMNALAADVGLLPPITVNSTTIGFAGQEWYVIGDGTAGIYKTADGAPANSVTLLLKSYNPYGNTAFDSSGMSSNYNGSTLHNKMLDIASGFPAKELALVNARASLDGINGAAVTGATFWPLSVSEANQVNGTLRSFGDNWWLRSPGNSYHYAAYVTSGGLVNVLGGSVSDSCAIRPAFNLNLSSVLFTSAASGASGKSAAAVGGGLALASAPPGAVKLTVLDNGQTLTVLGTTAQSTQSAGTLAFSYSGATTGTNQNVSCVLEQSGVITHYGKLANSASASAASGNLSIPLTGVANGTYTLKIFSEQANGDNLTDYAGTPTTMTVNVASGVGTVSGFGGTIQDTDATISPTTATFDKYASNTNYIDIPVTLTPGSYTLTKITCDGTDLTAGNLYSESAGVYTFGKTWLATLVNGSRVITFDMSGGTDPALTVTVGDSTPGPSPDTTPPTIISATATATGQTSARLEVSAADASVPLSYQWQVQGSWIDIPGATSAVFDYMGLTPGKTYTVRCRVTDSAGNVAYTNEMTFTMGTATVITGLPSAYTLYTGGRVSWTPAPTGGTWSYDSDYLSMTKDGDEVTFKALKEGKTDVTYTVNGVSHTVTITINLSTLPQTGDTANALPWMLLMLAGSCGLGTLLIYRKKKEHAQK